VVKEIASRVNVLYADEMEVKALADKCDEHWNEDEEERPFWGELKSISTDCCGLTHTRKS
jgi:hypothetical protein